MRHALQNLADAVSTEATNVTARLWSKHKLHSAFFHCKTKNNKNNQTHSISLYYLFIYICFNKNMMQ